MTRDLSTKLCGESRVNCLTLQGQTPESSDLYRGAYKSLARPTSRCILFDGENISFDASLVLYIYIYIYIQSVQGGMCQTSGECSLS